jgi:hypothetical protein
LLDQVRDVTRLKHYSLRPERTYCDWIERFIRYHELRHPRELREEEISAVFDASSARWCGRRFNPKPGAECAPISLQRGA